MPAERTIRYRKRCDCQPATASGPRVVIGEAEERGDRARFPTQFVRMACDECDTPWQRIEGEDDG